VLQRFISEDPIEFNGSDVNLYAYVGNSPTNSKDSIGMIRDCFTTACGGIPGGAPPLQGRKPDYCKFAGNIGPWNPDLMYVPSSGNYYYSVGSIGKNSTPAGASLTCGYIQQSGVDPDKFVQGLGSSGCAFYWVGACVSIAPNNDGSGLPLIGNEFGFGTPGAGVSGGYTNSFPDFSSNGTQDPMPQIPVGDGLYWTPETPFEGDPASYRP
jgi:hypothetical protein